MARITQFTGTPRKINDRNIVVTIPLRLAETMELKRYKFTVDEVDGRNKTPISYRKSDTAV